MTEQKGATLWFTGLPSSGKSTIAGEVYRQLLDRGIAAELLDGTEVRESLSRGLGFSREDREEHLRRIGYVARLLSRNGIFAVCAAVSPYRETRAEIRLRTTNFVEIFVDCPVAVAEQRDSEGQYQRAKRGELAEFTGVSAPYEVPDAPEVHIHSDRESVADASWKVMNTLELLGILPALPDPSRSAQEEDIRRRLAALGYL
jgi:adenylyl-sulfate kinase